MIEYCIPALCAALLLVAVAFIIYCSMVLAARVDQDQTRFDEQ